MTAQRDEQMIAQDGWIIPTRMPHEEDAKARANMDVVSRSQDSLHAVGLPHRVNTAHVPLFRAFRAALWRSRGLER